MRRGLCFDTLKSANAWNVTAPATDSASATDATGNNRADRRTEGAPAPFRLGLAVVSTRTCISTNNNFRTDGAGTPVKTTDTASANTVNGSAGTDLSTTGTSGPFCLESTGASAHNEFHPVLTGAGRTDVIPTAADATPTGKATTPGDIDTIHGTMVGREPTADDATSTNNSNSNGTAAIHFAYVSNCHAGTDVDDAGHAQPDAFRISFASSTTSVTDAASAKTFTGTGTTFRIANATASSTNDTEDNDAPDSSLEANRDIAGSKTKTVAAAGPGGCRI